jgi:hypothetical protein
MNQAGVKESEVRVAGSHQGTTLPNHTEHEDGHGPGHALNWRDINRVLFVAAAAGALWLLGGARNPYVEVATQMLTTFRPSAIWACLPIFQASCESVPLSRWTESNASVACSPSR